MAVELRLPNALRGFAAGREWVAGRGVMGPHRRRRVPRRRLHGLGIDQEERGGVGLRPRVAPRGFAVARGWVAVDGVTVVGLRPRDAPRGFAMGRGWVAVDGVMVVGLWLVA